MTDTPAAAPHTEAIESQVERHSIDYIPKAERHGKDQQGEPREAHFIL